jgi:sulfopyruvate decarboxylase subunit beta
MMSLTEALRVLHAVRRDEVVVTTMGTAREWMRLGTHPLDFVFVPSSMGQATSLGLGIALAQPSRRVVVCNGDGSMLMNLGSLVTITAQSPPNFTLLLFDNGVYEITGSQPTAGNPAIRNGAGEIDFPAIATACGFASIYQLAGIEDWRSAVREVITARGPTFAHLPVAPIPGGVGPKSPSPGPQRARDFAKALSKP